MKIMLERIRKLFSLRIKLLLTVVGVVLLFLSISTYFSVRQTGEIIKDQIKSYGTSMSRALADFCIEDLLSWNYPALQLYVDLIGEQDSQIRGIKIYHNDAIVAEYCSGKKDNSCDYELAGVFESPVEVKVQDEIELLGKVEVYLSSEKYEEFLKKQMNLLWILTVVLLLGDTFLSYYTVKVLILNPLREITSGAEIVGKGNFKHRIYVNNTDEIGDLASTINSMSQRLQISYNKTARQTKNLKDVRNALMKNLSETETAKKKVEEERNKTFAMISNLVDPVIVIDNDQKIILVNISAKKILGIQDSDINKGLNTEGPNCVDCLPKRLCLCDFKKVIRIPYVSRVIRTNENHYPIVEELTIGKKERGNDGEIDDQRKVFKVLTSEVKDSKGKSYGHMKIFYDLTREKLIDEMKSEFISIAAHQLRTPSSGVKWALDMILNDEMGKVSSEAKEYIGKAAEANELMVKLVNNLLNVSYIETGKFAYKFKKVDIKKVVRNVIKFSDITAEQKGVKMSSMITNQKIDNIIADQEKIEQAIQNLVNNAIKYSESGDKVTISLKVSSKEPKEIEIAVKDEGIGVNKKDLKQLFSKFYRGENAKRLQTEGSGLGLFIAKSVIEAHGGKVSCSSILDEGSTFKINLPLKNKVDLSQSKKTPKKKS